METEMQLQTVSELNTTPGQAWGTYIAEASTLGMEPGRWSILIPATKGFGNGQPFILQNSNRAGVGYCTYRQANGCIDLIVFDD